MTTISRSGRRLPSAADARSLSQFAADVRFHLTQHPRQLPPRYLYDELGSALFEAICRLPWYPVTRTECRLLARHAADIMDAVDPLSAIVELGCGSGEKLRTILEAADRCQRAIAVHLVDVSRSALELSSGVLASIGAMRVSMHEAAYEEGLRDAAREIGGAGRTLVLFLGSNIGNFDRPAAEAFLRVVRHSVAERDALLLGVDLVKPERDLLLAYDDPLGVTAAFNRNLLVRINRELGGDFDMEQFAHRAVWNARESRVEMHLVARSAQHVHIEGAELDLRFERDEPIWTESSYKYRPADISALLEASGFCVASQWLEEEDGFAVTLAEAG